MMVSPALFVLKRWPKWAEMIHMFMIHMFEKIAV